MHKRMLIGLLVLFTLSGYVLPVSACSSGGPLVWNDYLPKLLAQSDVVVIGQYTQLDDASTNGIFHVQSYLQGSGNAYLTISASDIRNVENSWHVERYHYLCGLLDSKHLYTVGTYIYFLTRQLNGSYLIHHERYFESPDETTLIVGDLNQNPNDIVHWNSDDLSTNISTQVGHAPQKPQEDTPYPRTTPILLTTQDNQNFLLPVDNAVLVPIPDDKLVDLQRDQYACYAPCTAYSPNGLDKVYLQEPGDEPHTIDTLLPYVESNAVGQRIVFSASSDTYALWKDKQIQVYALWYPNLGYPDNRVLSMYDPALFNSIPAGDSLQFPVVWSPDGRTMAYSTNEGLWLWDALTLDSTPRLLSATQTKVPTARYFSPHGRYLAIEDSGKRYNLDLVSRQELPDGYVSPDDRKLLIFDTAAQKPTTLEMAYLAPGVRRFVYYSDVQYLNVQWMDNTYFRASINGFSYTKFKAGEPYEENGQTVTDAIYYVVDEPFYDTVRYHSSGIDSVSYDLRVPYQINDVQMRDFTYKTGPGLIEVSVDGYSVSINEFLPISLASALPSPIKKATWLPSAFYYDHNET